MRAGRSVKHADGPVNGPIRTCIGCRKRASAMELVRLTLRQTGKSAEGVPDVVADRTATLPGRGAWVHPRVECLREMVRRRAVGRALRVQAYHLDPDGLVADVLAAATDRDEGIRPDMSTP